MKKMKINGLSDTEKLDLFKNVLFNHFCCYIYVDANEVRPTITQALGDLFDQEELNEVRGVIDAAIREVIQEFGTFAIEQYTEKLGKAFPDFFEWYTPSNEASI